MALINTLILKLIYPNLEGLSFIFVYIHVISDLNPILPDEYNIINSIDNYTRRLLVLQTLLFVGPITIVLYVKEIFENWIRIVNKNQRG